MFRRMPAALRDAYKLAKIVRDDTFCPSIKNTGLTAKCFVTSYILKTVTLMMYMFIMQVSKTIAVDLDPIYDI